MRAHALEHHTLLLRQGRATKRFYILKPSGSIALSNRRSGLSRAKQDSKCFEPWAPLPAYLTNTVLLTRANASSGQAGVHGLHIRHLCVCGGWRAVYLLPKAHLQGRHSTIFRKTHQHSHRVKSNEKPRQTYLNRSWHKHFLFFLSF